MVAMESAGSFWKPLYNILESSGLNAMVVNNGKSARSILGMSKKERNLTKVLAYQSET